MIAGGPETVTKVTSSKDEAPNRVPTPARKAMLRPFERGAHAPAWSQAYIGKQVSPNGVSRSFSGIGSIFGLRPQLGGAEEITSPYHEAWIVHACVRWLADAAASVRPMILASSEKDAPEVGPEHPVSKLFAKPNDVTTWSQLADAAFVHRLTSGEDFWFLADAQGRAIQVRKDGLFAKLPAQIVQVSGDAVGDVRDANGLVTQWFYSAVGSTQRVEFSPEATIQFRTYDPADPMRGIGPVQVLTRQLSLGFQTERYLESGARAGGPGAFLTYSKTLGEESERTQQELDQLSRDGDMTTRFKVLDGPGEWNIHPIPTSPKDMQALDVLDRVNHIACGALGVAPPLVGIYGDAIFKNIEEGSRQSWLNVASKLKALAREINSGFFDRCAIPEVRRMRFAFDFADIDALRVDETDRYVKASEIAAKGIGVSFVGACDSIGLEPAPTAGGKLELVSSTYQTVEQLQNPDPQPAPAETPPAPADPNAKRHILAPNPRFLRTIRPLEEAERREYSRSFVARRLAPAEKRLRKQVRGWLGSYADAQLKLVRQFADGKALRAATEKSADDLARIIAELELDRDTWVKLLDSAIGATIEDIWRDSLSDAAREIGVVSLPMTDPRVLQRVLEQRINVSEGVTSTTAKRVREAVFDVLRESSSIGTLQQRVKEELPTITDELARVFGNNDARALAIARTETGHASNGARIAQFQAEGIKQIQWVTAHDDRVREAHESIDGEVRDIGSEFLPNLRYPHDPNAPASLVVNCRCTLLPLIPE